MPIDPEFIRQESGRNEKVAQKRLRKMGYEVRRLDHQGPRKRPEFLVSDTSGPMFICEVKTIFSGGYLSERHAHLSTADSQFLNTGLYQVEIDFSKIDDNLRNAAEKYDVLTEDHAEYLGLSYLVVFFFDFFADKFRLYPKHMSTFPTVSGIGKIVTNHALRRAADKLPLTELKERAQSNDASGLPPPSKDIKLVENECARTKLPAHFVDACITYD